MLLAVVMDRLDDVLVRAIEAYRRRPNHLH
jgi:hypothetical protein